MLAHKSLIGLLLILVIALLIGGIYYPGSFMMSLAGTDTLYSLIRGAIVVLLIGLLVTNPPRSYVLRAIIGVWSVLLAATSVQLLYSYRVNILDAIVFIEIAIIFAIEALETRRRTIPVSKKHSPARKIHVLSS